MSLSHCHFLESSFYCSLFCLHLGFHFYLLLYICLYVYVFFFCSLYLPIIGSLSSLSSPIIFLDHGSAPSYWGGNWNLKPMFKIIILLLSFEKQSCLVPLSIMQLLRKEGHSPDSHIYKMEMDSVKHSSWAGVNNVSVRGREDHQTLYLVSVVERLSIRWNSSGHLGHGNPSELPIPGRVLDGFTGPFRTHLCIQKLVICFDNFRAVNKCMVRKNCRSRKAEILVPM